MANSSIDFTLTNSGFGVEGLPKGNALSCAFSSASASCPASAVSASCLASTASASCPTCTTSALTASCW